MIICSWLHPGKRCKKCLKPVKSMLTSTIFNFPLMKIQRSAKQNACHFCDHQGISKNWNWFKSGVHLGNTIEDQIDGMKQDTKIKRAMYIQRNNEIEQEFYFAHPSTKFHLNTVYNSHFSGSSLWNLFSHETEMMENRWNRSFNIMYKLPLATHGYFIEPISGKPHA